MDILCTVKSGSDSPQVEGGSIDKTKSSIYLNSSASFDNFRGKEAWTEREDAKLVQLQSLEGNKWSKIAVHFPNRTANSVKGRWNLLLRKSVSIYEEKERKEKEDSIEEDEYDSDDDYESVSVTVSSDTKAIGASEEAYLKYRALPIPLEYSFCL
eukprot:TRINITY_DN23331_c0_g1_i1.p1 TRINITY_DN23331_c0_g1~~TRINITY_DN23331_c0_g1_i1.p1  ORF type:complete len:155 (+),score=13.87 TRINITY_DN23331_c0_g1_i1:51-515(+)